MVKIKISKLSNNKYQMIQFSAINRSRRSQMFFKIGVLKNFAIFIGNICVGVSF